MGTAVLPPWQRMVMTAGLYVNPLGRSEVAGLRRGEAGDRLLYYREGVNAVITVRERMEGGHRIRTYQANGKQEALSRDGRATGTWAALGHVPLLLHRGRASEALLVGLGAGITLGAMEYYPLRYIDVVEIEPAVVEAAAFFRASNNNALEDPRVHMHIADGRSFLFSTKRKYDVIVSAVSDPWITGVSNLFTYEYFRALRERLRPHGVVAIWFQNYRATTAEMKTALRTFAAAFPHASIWFRYTDALDLIVVGSMDRLVIDLDSLAARVAAGGVREALGLMEVRRPVDFFSLFLMGESDLHRYAGRGVLNTDERPIMEFSLPRHLYMDPRSGIRNVQDILAAAREITPRVSFRDRARQERFYLELGKTYNTFTFRLPQALRAFEKVLELDPSNTEAAALAAGLSRELGLRARPGAPGRRP